MPRKKVYSADEVEWMLRHLDDEITEMANAARPFGLIGSHGLSAGLDQAARVVANMAHYIHDMGEA